MKANKEIYTQTLGVWKKTVFSLFCYVNLIGCSSFVEVEPPLNTLISENVFRDPATVESALANLWFSMREEGMVSGNSGFTTLMGIYSDELDYFGFNAQFEQFYRYTINPQNSVIRTWWLHGYEMIYAANDIIIGVENSAELLDEDKNRFKGQALFARAYVHSLLVEVFGDIPYVTTTDYRINNRVERTNKSEVYDKIITDLTEAIELLDDTYIDSGERVLPDSYAARSLLARIALRTGNWNLAENEANRVLSAFQLEPDISKVFLKESPETIWQFKSGLSPRNTQEANQLIIQAIPGQQFSLSNNLIQSFETGDLRLEHWTNTISNQDSSITLSYAFKYKARFTEAQSLEYSIVFRLAEQLLIRAEARAHLGDLEGALQDLNAIRNRAGLSDISATNISNLLEAIFKERQVELFAEHGLRWFDLKRLNKTSDIIGTSKPNWQESNNLLPLPESELELNPNLLPQNPGY